MEKEPITQKKGGWLKKGDEMEVYKGHWGKIVHIERPPFMKWIVLITFQGGTRISVNHNHKFNVRNTAPNK